MMRCHTGAVVARAFNVLIHKAFEVIAQPAGKGTTKNSTGGMTEGIFAEARGSPNILALN